MGSKKNNYWAGGIFLFLVVLLAGLKLITGIVRVWSWQQLKTNFIVVNDDKIRWVNMSANKNEEVVVFDVPPQMLVRVVGMQGELRSDVLWRFASGEKKSVEITKRSLELMFGAVADGLIYVPGNEEDVKKLVGRSLLSLTSRSDLSLVKRLVIYWNWKDVNDGQIKQLGIPTALGVVEELPDGSRVVRIDERRMEQVVADYLVDDKVIEGGARISIKNWSGQEGMAKLAERQARAVGGLVVEVGEGSTKDGWCWYSADKKTLDENRGLVLWVWTRMKCEFEPNNDLREGEFELKLGKEWGEVYRR